MKTLTDELKIINTCITFASENDLVYSILKYPTITKLEKVEIDIGKGVLHDTLEGQFGASFAVTKGGNLKYRQIHVFPLCDIQQRERVEKFRLYLESKLEGIECSW